MTVDQMREEIIKAYSGPNWRLKVMGMPDRQVIAIYKDMNRKGRFLKKRRKEPKMKETCVQLNMWDLLKEPEEGN